MSNKHIEAFRKHVQDHDPENRKQVEMLLDALEKMGGTFSRPDCIILSVSGEDDDGDDGGAVMIAGDTTEIPSMYHHVLSAIESHVGKNAAALLVASALQRYGIEISEGSQKQLVREAIIDVANSLIKAASDDNAEAGENGFAIHKKGTD